MTNSRIAGVSTALPSNRYTSSQLLAETSSWLSGGSRECFERFVKSSQVDTRYFAFTLDEIFNLRDAKAREAAFREHGLALGMAAAKDLIASHSIDCSEIETIIVTSCTVPIIPGLDVEMVNALSLARGIQRLPIYQYGCAGGGASLRISRNLGNTLIVAIELCSLVFQPEDFSKGNLVGSALFSDGAAAAYISRETGNLEIVDSLSYLIPDSSNVMGYDLADDGAHLRLSPELPQTLLKNLPFALSGLLKRNHLDVSSIAAWIVHPGGSKILTLLEENLDIRRDRIRWSWNILNQFGNMSSATLLFVLSEYLKDGDYKRGDLALMIGIGPGLSIELSLLRHT